MSVQNVCRNNRVTLLALLSSDNEAGGSGTIEEHLPGWAKEVRTRHSFLSNLNRLSTFFHCWKEKEMPNKVHFVTHLNYVAALPCEILEKFEFFAVYLEKMQTKCNDFVYTKFI